MIITNDYDKLSYQGEFVLNKTYKIHTNTIIVSYCAKHLPQLSHLPPVKLKLTKISTNWLYLSEINKYVRPFNYTIFHTQHPRHGF